MAIGELLKPNGFNILLSITLIVPSLLISGLLLDKLLNAIPLGFLWVIVLGIVISYAISACIDKFIQNKTIKIIIASISALISIVITYIVIRSMTMVCDPVHRPVVCDPVHKPTQCETACQKIMEEAGNVSDIIRLKFNECLQNCYK
jgi:hypothetical protein